MRRFSLGCLVATLVTCTTITSAQVKISQVFGGGANTGAPVERDYIEIYNAGAAAQSLSGWSVQYASATGTTWSVTSLPAVSLAPGQYLLVAEAIGTSTLASPQCVSLPTPDVTGTIAMASNAFKVALVSSTTALVGGTPTYAGAPALVDFVGSGTANWNDSAAVGAAFSSANNAPAAGNNIAIHRLGCGAQDTNVCKDDWAQGIPGPRNTVTALNAGLTALGTVFPYTARQGETVSLRCTPRLCGTNTLNPGTTVVVNLTAFGLGPAAVVMLDDGLGGDDLAGDGLFMANVTIPVAQAAGSYNLPYGVTDGMNSGGGYFGVAVVASATAPANDNCNNATALAVPSTTAVLMTASNVESNPIVSSVTTPTSGFSSRRGRWYQVVGSGNTMTASTCSGTIVNSVLMVFCGNCDGLSEVTSNDDAGTVLCPAGSTASVASWCSIMGQTYYIWVAPSSTGAQTSTINLVMSDDGIACTGAMPCTTCPLLAPVAQTETEPRFGIATNDGCDSSPNLFTTIPGPVGPTTLNGTCKAIGGNRDVDWYRFLATTSDFINLSVTGQAQGYQIVLNQLNGPGGTCPSATLAVSGLPDRCASASLAGVIVAGNWYAIKVIGFGIEGSPAGAIFGGQIPAAGSDNYTINISLGGIAANDACASALVLPSVGTGTAGVATVNTTASLDGPALGCGVAVDKDVWYSFTPSGTCSLPWEISTCSNTPQDTVIEVYQGTCAGPLVACSDDDPACGTGIQSKVVAILTPGTTYIIRAASKGFPAVGDAMTLVVMPGNNVCGQNASLFTIPGTGGSACTNLAAATSEGNAASSSMSGTGQRDVFFYFTPSDPCATGWTFSTCTPSTPDVDTNVSIHTACPTPTANNQLGTDSADQGCGSGNLSLATWTNLVVGTPYIIRVGMWSASATPNDVTLTVTPAGLTTNDNCASAAALTVPSTVTGNTLCGTNDGTASCDPSGATGKDLWYTVTLAATGNLHLDTIGSAIDTVLSVYTGTCGALTEIACNDDAPVGCGAPGSVVDLSALPAGTYTVRVSDKGLGGGTFTLKASTVLNDNCCSAIVVGCPSVTAGSTVGATAETGLPAGCIGPQAPGLSQSFSYTNSVWYKVTAPATGTMYADTLASTYDSKIFVWTGSCGALTCVSGNDDIQGSPYQSKVGWKANMGQDYFLMVGPYSSTTGAFTLTVSCAPTPSNDDCAAPTVLAPVLGGSIPGTTIGATCDAIYTSSTAYPSCASIGGIFDVWYSYTPCANANLTLDTCGAYDTTLSVHTACPGLAGPSNEVSGACNNDGPMGCTPGSQLTVAVTGGTTYLIRVVGALGANPEGNFVLSWAVDGPLWYPDADGDLFGNAAMGVLACTQPPGYISTGGDCNDSNPLVNPAATEVCDMIDNDCDGLTDDADPGVVGQQTWYADADGDTYGNPAASLTACFLPMGYVSNNLDCDDNNAAINPAATEVCDGVDNDCDGLTDDADPGVIGQATWYQDLDGDTYGNASVSQVACFAPVGYVSNSTDCNDANAAVNPGATEVCNGIDDDCDTQIDEVCPSNDFCVSAVAIGDGVVGGNNLGAASEILDVTCGAVTNDVWFSYTNTAGCDRTVTASMCAADGGSASFDSVIHVFSGTCGALTLVTCSDNSCGLDPNAAFTMPGGATYLIAVSAVAPGPGGVFSMAVSSHTAKSIQVGPGCSDGGGPGPSLTIDAPPVLGSYRTLTLAGAAPASGGLLMMSNPAGSFTALPGGCTLFLEQGSMIILNVILTDGAGGYVLSDFVPSAPTWECVQINVQGFVFPVGGLPLYQASSGLQVTLGY